MWIETLRAAMFDAISEADMREIMRKLVSDAKAGNFRAQKIIFESILAAPRVSVHSEVTVSGMPTNEFPGTAGKLNVMRERAAKGLPLHHDKDTKQHVNMKAGRPRA